MDGFPEMDGMDGKAPIWHQTDQTDQTDRPTCNDARRVRRGHGMQSEPHNTPECNGGEPRDRRMGTLGEHLSCKQPPKAHLW